MKNATAPQSGATHPHCAVGLIVTGEGERDFLPELFRSIMKRADCHFEVLRQIGQRLPITSPVRRLRMVGTGQTIPTSDEQEIGLEARRFLRNKPCHFVILIDDVEAPRRNILSAVFLRYRTALNTMLHPDERQRAAVQFLANMLEAYYFADSAAVNQALGPAILAGDHSGDVELIDHPKGKLKALYPAFDARLHGAQIVPLLDLDHILDNPQTCAFLRSLFGWCVHGLCACGHVSDADFMQRFQLPSGVRAAVTKDQ